MSVTSSFRLSSFLFSLFSFRCCFLPTVFPRLYFSFSPFTIFIFLVFVPFSLSSSPFILSLSLLFFLCFSLSLCFFILCPLFLLSHSYNKTSNVLLRASCLWIVSSPPDDMFPSGCSIHTTHPHDNTSWDMLKTSGLTRPTHRCNVSIRHSQILSHSSTQTLDISQKRASSAILILTCLLAQNGIVLATWLGIWNLFLLAFCFQRLSPMEHLRGVSQGLKSRTLPLDLLPQILDKSPTFAVTK